ncbi:hypothetical protein CDV55_102394 [Aspergillus turcosus]|nr:hypothetical protein CDV55_102394 [Aspergillus turcosus]
MCVGIASVAREGVSYLQSAVGSVLEGLSATEREALYLIVFIAHTNPAEHPAYLQPWLHALADRVLLYDPDALDIDHVRGLETPEEKSGAHEKGLLDYTYLLKACGSINTSYTVMLEDDVIALDGWYHRTKHALAAIEQQTLKEGADFFPQARINDLVSWYESKRAGYVDMLTEDYADQNGETRWALTPCVLQHVGSKSSKTNSPSRHKNQRTASETIWNFRFEEHDVESLRREHELQKEAEEGLHV